VIATAAVRLPVWCEFPATLLNVAMRVSMTRVLSKGFTVRFLLNIAASLKTVAMDMAMVIAMATKPMMLVAVKASAMKTPASFCSWQLAWRQEPPWCTSADVATMWHHKVRCHYVSAKHIRGGFGTVMRYSPGLR